MRRRQFMTLLCGAAAALPFVARAQQGERVRRIGVLIPAYAQTDREGQARLAAFVSTLHGFGWSEGRNLGIEVRWPGGDVARAKADAAWLVGAAPDAIVVSSNPALAELKRLTATIPLIFVQVSEPTDSGFVSSLARPGGNITGFQNFEPAIGGKWLGVLKDVAPQVRRAAMLLNPDIASNVGFLRAAESIAPSLGMQVIAAGVRDAADIERGITAFGGEAHSLIIAPTPVTVAHRGSIIGLAARRRLPAVYPYRYFAMDGGLVSYGPDQLDQWRGAASYVDRVLRGAKPGDLPVQAPTKYELVVNLKTAKALGFDIPPSFPLRADEVIE
jgi:putative ABC transport system substrate-binding protein